jgi:preprotein translocase subunit YajC
MDFLSSLWLSHWHCVVPLIAIAVVMLLRNQRDRKKEKDK